MTYYNDKPPARDNQVLKIARITFVVLAIIGGLLFHSFRYQLLGGFGIGLSLFSLASFFHINKDLSRKSDNIDTKMTWFLIALVFLGLLLLLVNHYMSGPLFYTGISASLILICGITYCIELLLTWSDSVR